MIITCEEKTCGQPCSMGRFKGVCNENGNCVDPIENPCVLHGCEGKKCGDSCLLGDIMGVCDAFGDCNFNIRADAIISHCGMIIGLSKTFSELSIELHP